MKSVKRLSNQVNQQGAIFLATNPNTYSQYNFRPIYCSRVCRWAVQNGSVVWKQNGKMVPLETIWVGKHTFWPVVKLMQKECRGICLKGICQLASADFLTKLNWNFSLREIVDHCLTIINMDTNYTRMPAKRMRKQVEISKVFANFREQHAYEHRFDCLGQNVKLQGLYDILLELRIQFFPRTTAKFTDFRCWNPMDLLPGKQIIFTPQRCWDANKLLDVLLQWFANLFGYFDKVFCVSEYSQFQTATNRWQKYPTLLFIIIILVIHYYGGKTYCNGGRRRGNQFIDPAFEEWKVVSGLGIQKLGRCSTV